MQDSSPLFLKVARLGRCHGVCEISVASRLAISVFPYFSLFLTSDDFICFLHHIYISQILYVYQGARFMVTIFVLPKI